VFAYDPSEWSDLFVATAGVSLWSRWGVRLTAVVPLVVAGASLLGESGGGLYWLAAGIAFAIAGAIANAWVLLVEILR
jgi:hypothetical protein